jgi:hypothetical protein
MAQPTQALNQFGQKGLKGVVAAVPNPVTLSVVLVPVTGTTLYAGDAVKLASGASPMILVDLAASTDPVFGYVIRNQKKSSFLAGDALEIALANSVIVLEAYGAINRGQQIEWYAAGHQVKANAGTNPVSGTVLDQSAATGDLIRVLVRNIAEYSSSSSSSSCRSSSSSSSLSA